MSNIKMTVTDGVVDITTDDNTYLVLRVDVVHSGLAVTRHGPSTPLLFLRPGESLRCRLVLPLEVPVQDELRRKGVGEV